MYLNAGTVFFQNEAPADKRAASAGQTGSGINDKRHSRILLITECECRDDVAFEGCTSAGSRRSSDVIAVVVRERGSPGGDDLLRTEKFTRFVWDATCPDVEKNSEQAASEILENSALLQLELSLVHVRFGNVPGVG